MKDIQVIPIIVDVSTSLRSINFYLIKTTDQLILVDAGLNNDASMNALVHTLEKNGWSPGDITEIILTHNHYDHVGLVNPLTDKYPIPVYAHKDAIPRLKRDRGFLEMRVEFFMNLYEEMGCGRAGDKQARYLRDSIEKNSNQTIWADIHSIEERNFDLDILEVPGHAPDQIALYHPGTKELVAGDLIIEHISSNALIEPDFNGQRLPTLTQHRDSLEKIQNLDISQIYAGHGKVINEPKGLIQLRLEGIERKVERIKLIIGNEAKTANDIALAYYKKSYETQFSLVMSEIIGHLDYMEKNEVVWKEQKNGVWYYSVVTK